MRRLAAAIVALAALLVGFVAAFAALFLAGMGAPEPDPTAEDGDPCCPIPDDTAEAVGWAAEGVLLGTFAAVPLACGAALLHYALRGRPLGWWGWIGALAAFPLTLAAVSAVTLVVP